MENIAIVICDVLRAPVQPYRGIQVNSDMSGGSHLVMCL